MVQHIWIIFEAILVFLFVAASLMRLSEHCPKDPYFGIERQLVMGLITQRKRGSLHCTTQGSGGEKELLARGKMSSCCLRLNSAVGAQAPTIPHISGNVLPPKNCQNQAESGTQGMCTKLVSVTLSSMLRGNA